MCIPTYRSSNKLNEFDSVSMISTTTDQTSTIFDSQSEYEKYYDHISSIEGSSVHSSSRRETRRNVNHYNVAPFRKASYLKRHNSLQSSMSSLADSTMPLRIKTVKLNIDKTNFLGISLVGQNNRTGGIYVGSILKEYAIFI